MALALGLTTTGYATAQLIQEVTGVEYATYTVEGITVRTLGEVFVEVSSPVEHCEGNPTVLELENPNDEVAVKLLIAAQLSNRPVELYVDGVEDGEGQEEDCTIRSLTLR